MPGSIAPKRDNRRLIRLGLLAGATIGFVLVMFAIFNRDAVESSSAATDVSRLSDDQRQQRIGPARRPSSPVAASHPVRLLLSILGQLPDEARPPNGRWSVVSQKRANDWLGNRFVDKTVYLIQDGPCFVSESEQGGYLIRLELPVPKLGFGGPVLLNVPIERVWPGYDQRASPPFLGSYEFVGGRPAQNGFEYRTDNEALVDRLETSGRCNSGITCKVREIRLDTETLPRTGSIHNTISVSLEILSVEIKSDGNHRSVAALGKRQPSVFGQHDAKVVGIVGLPKSDQILTADRTGDLRVWDTTELSLIRRLPGGLSQAAKEQFKNSQDPYDIYRSAPRFRECTYIEPNLGQSTFVVNGVSTFDRPLRMRYDKATLQQRSFVSYKAVRDLIKGEVDDMNKARILIAPNDNYFVADDSRFFLWIGRTRPKPAIIKKLEYSGFGLNSDDSQIGLSARFSVDSRYLWVVLNNKPQIWDMQRGKQVVATDIATSTVGETLPPDVWDDVAFVAGQGRISLVDLLMNRAPLRIDTGRDERHCIATAWNKSHFAVADARGAIRVWSRKAGEIFRCYTVPRALEITALFIDADSSELIAAASETGGLNELDRDMAEMMAQAEGESPVSRRSILYRWDLSDTGHAASSL